jgi:hypothetical protein
MTSAGYFAPASAHNYVRFGLEGIMAGLFFLLALLLGGAAFVFKQAAAEIPLGTSWAVEVCSTSKLFCHDPQYLAYAGGALLVVAIGFKLGSLANG